MKKVLLLSLLTFTTSMVSFGQGDLPGKEGCRTYTELQKIFEMYPEAEEAYYANELLTNSMIVSSNGKKADTNYVIPVVFHVLHDYGVENISDANVYNLMEQLNIEFNAADPDSINLVDEYKDMHGNAKIELRLAALDPFGNCTNGIEHIYSHETFIGDAYSKVNQWNRAKYLNIWVVDVVGTPGAAAYATPPGSVEGPGFWVDGVLSQFSYVGTAGASVLTHEIGHYFNLKHVWGDLDLINNAPSVCGDDGVADTPLTMGWKAPCPNGLYSSTNGYGWMTCGPDEVPNTTVFDFDSVVTTSGMVDPTPVPVTQLNLSDPSNNIVFSTFTANGVGTNPTTVGSFGYDNWDNGALDNETVYANLTGTINTAKYYEFTVGPEMRGRLLVDSLVFTVARDASGPRTFAVRWDVDNYAANLTASSQNSDVTVQAGDVFFYAYDSTYTESNFAVQLPDPELNAASPVTFRIYAWNAEDAAGDFIVDDVMVRGTIGLVEDVQNYMEYSYCDVHFTPGQVNRMHNALQAITGQRNVLWQDTTLITTGVKNQTMPQTALTVPLCTPVADFSSDRKMACVGDLVQFSNESWNAVVDSVYWTFEGASTPSSTSQNPMVSWDTPGYKKVTLKAINDNGNDVVVKNNYIYISPSWPDFIGPQSLDLESANAGWFIVENPEDNWGRFALSNGTGYNGSRSYKLGNYKDVSQADPFTADYFYNGRLGGSVDNLITPSFDLSTSSNVVVTFKYSYATNATNSGDITEVLKVYRTRNCGDSWVPVKTIQGTSLVTAGFAGNSDYAPDNNNKWVETSFSYPTVAQDTKTRFKFEFTASDVSSNLYIDDINITGVLGIESNVIDLMELTVYPNPTSGEALTVNFIGQNETTEFILRDVQGKVITTQTIEATSGQVVQTLNNTADLQAACYFLEVRVGDHSVTKKVVVL